MEVYRGIWNRPECPLQDDDNVSRCYSTGRPQVATPIEEQYLAVTAPKKQMAHIIRPVSSAHFSHWKDSVKKDRFVATDALGRLVYKLVDLSDATYCNSLSPADCSFGGGIILGSRTDHDQTGTMKSQIYENLILEQHVSLLRGAEFVFIDDNASSPCKHRKRMPSIGVYPSYGLASILTGLESSRACVRHA
ncbi:nibrin [Trichonephila clavipes]|nr:nibrin [Trichonephila clavipes]